MVSVKRRGSRKGDEDFYRERGVLERDDRLKLFTG